MEDLFKKFASAKGDDKKKALATEICTELSVPAQIEEEILYPACQGQVEEDFRRESYGRALMAVAYVYSTP